MSHDQRSMRGGGPPPGEVIRRWLSFAEGAIERHLREKRRSIYDCRAGGFQCLGGPAIGPAPSREPGKPGKERAGAEGATFEQDTLTLLGWFRRCCPGASPDPIEALHVHVVNLNKGSPPAQPAVLRDSLTRAKLVLASAQDEEREDAGAGSRPESEPTTPAGEKGERPAAPEADARLRAARINEPRRAILLVLAHRGATGLDAKVHLTGAELALILKHKGAGGHLKGMLAELGAHGLIDNGAHHGRPKGYFLTAGGMSLLPHFPESRPS